MVHATPTQVLLTTTLPSLVMQLSGSLAHAVSLIHQFLSHELTPQATATFERELSALLREVGHHIMTWVLNRIEPENPKQAPSRLWVGTRAYRRRRTYRTQVATLFGTVVVWRLLYEPLEPGPRSIHPLELRLGLEAGLATPALAERIGHWAGDHSQRHVLEILSHDHGVHWSCTTLRKLLASLRAGMAPHRHEAQVDHVVAWLHRARQSKGRFSPRFPWAVMASTSRCAVAPAKKGPRPPCRYWTAGANASGRSIWGRCRKRVRVP